MATEPATFGPYRNGSDAVGRAFVMAQRGCTIRALKAIPNVDSSYLLGDVGLSATLRRRPNRVGKRDWIALVSTNGQEPRSGVNLENLKETDAIRFVAVAKVPTLESALEHDARVIHDWNHLGAKLGFPVMTVVDAYKTFQAEKV